MDAEFKNLKAGRAAIRSVTTKLINKIKLSFDTADESENYVILLEQLEDKITKLKKLDADILKFLDEKDIETEIITSEEYNDKLIEIRCKILKKIRDLNVINSNASTSAVSNSFPHQAGASSAVKLPKISVNKFYGDYAEFIEFMSQFETVIDKNPSLTAIEKLIYLKSLLGGNAASAISGFELTDKNYESALELLKSRFGQKNLLINSHIGILLNLTPIKSSSDSFGLRKLLDKAEIQIRNLESLGIKSSSFSSLLTPIILKKLPSDLTLEFSKQNNDDNWDLNKLLSFLNKELSSRQKAESITLNQKQITFESKLENRGKSKMSSFPPASRSSAHALMMSGVNQKCLFCSQEHKSELCNLVDIDRKKEILKREGRCFLCLKVNHKISQCRKKEYCAFCNRKHSEAICYQKYRSSENKNKLQISNNLEENVAEKIISAVSYNQTNNVFLQTCCVKIRNKECYFNVRTLLDCASMRSFVTQDVAKQLNLQKIRQEKLTVFTFGSQTPVEKVYDVVLINLENRCFSNSKIQIEALVTDRISGSNIPPPEYQAIKKHKVLNDLFLADTPGCHYNIAILIGADFYYNVVTGVIKHLNNNLVAVETIFGWCLQGKNKVDPISLVMNVIVEEELLSEQVRMFWDFERSGLIDETCNSNFSENEIMKSFESNIKYENKRYKVSLPWKHDKKLLDNNREIAEQRFLRLKGRFRRNAELFIRYQEVLKDYLDQKIIELVPDSVDDEINLTFYLPHREVIREVGSTKLRIVHDGSSHAPNFPSLNDCLDSGLNLYPEIFNILLRFRFNPIAFITDIKQAFLQIMLDERDRDVTRFFFTKDPNDETLPPIIYRFTRILFGINSSPFLLAATIKHHLKKYSKLYPVTVDFLDKNVYVDDVIGSFRTVEEAHIVAKQSIHIFDEASMQLHKWRTNSKELDSLWEKENILSDSNIGNFCLNNSSVKVLGIAWDNLRDILYFDLNDLVSFLKKKIDTKRFVLQALSRIYDPIGFLGPFIVRIKCLMQKIWSLGTEWDEHLPNEIYSSWKCWCEEVPLLAQLCIPRYYFPEASDFEIDKLELHCFSDASLIAYGAVAYFRVTTRNKEIHTVFVASKNRVAPLKILTLPKLELMGALLSSKLCTSILKALKLNISCYFWIDSKIAYYWIKGSPDRFKPFVKNRIVEIHKLTSPENWHHCPGSDNPADLVSRGIKVSKLLNDSTWFQGPNWLQQPPDFWPNHNLESEVSKLDSDLLEEKTTVMNAIVYPEKEKLMAISKFSNLCKLLRITAWVRRVIAKFRKQPCESGPLTAIEIQEAENLWIKIEQNEAYSSEIDLLLKDKPIFPSSKILSLVPFLDEKSVVRIKGRLEESSCSSEEIHPILLPNKSKFTELLIRHLHEKYYHLGVSSTLAEIRNKYWIPKARQIVKRIIKSCLVCRKYSLKPAKQITAQLPKDRVTKAAPFTVVGIDFTGPVFIKTDQKELKKSYIALFTCSVTRAVHIELVSDMSIKNFILAFRRFLARRGNCCVIYSDNAKTFKGTSEIIKCIGKIIVDPEVKNFLTTQNITWKFIAPQAPWWGGFYERLMKSLKDPLRKILGKALVNFEEMCTILAEIESVVNRRPLTYVSNDAGDIQPLSPLHFLIPSTEDVDYPLHFTEIFSKSSTKECLTRRRLYQTKLLTQVWNKWRNQYLLQLKSAHCFTSPTVEKNLKEGDVVLLEGNTKSKLLWPMGIIETVHRGRDSRVRSCDVRTQKGTFKRPIQLLYPLEIS